MKLKWERTNNSYFAPGDTMAIHPEGSYYQVWVEINRATLGDEVMGRHIYDAPTLAAAKQFAERFAGRSKPTVYANPKVEQLGKGASQVTTPQLLELHRKALATGQDSTLTEADMLALDPDGTHMLSPVKKEVRLLGDFAIFRCLLKLTNQVNPTTRYLALQIADLLAFPLAIPKGASQCGTIR